MAAWVATEAATEDLEATAASAAMGAAMGDSAVHTAADMEGLTRTKPGGPPHVHILYPETTAESKGEKPDN